MRIVKRNRYYCDFCKKAGGSGGHIAKHERSCTKNPNRICKVCGLLEVQQVPIADLKALLPQCKATDFGFEDDASSTVENLVRIALPRLREKAHNCPACIMAALRQSGIPVPLAKDFNFTNEMKDIWQEINEANLRECHYGNF